MTHSPPLTAVSHGDRTVVALDSFRRARGTAAGVTAIRVFLVDGAALVRAGFRAVLERRSSIGVVGEAADADAAVELAGRLRPELILMDRELPGLDSVEATLAALAETGAAVMLLIRSESDEAILPALRAGATGLLLKDTEPTELIGAVERLARGEALFSPSIARRLIAELAARPEPSAPELTLLDELTAREREVVALVALGHSNDEIAARLVVTPATAATHVSRAMVKLRARDRSQLVVFAYQVGLAT